MFHFLYKMLGVLMLFWYSCYRWTLLGDTNKYEWATFLINRMTALLSIAFIVPVLYDSQKFATPVFACLAIFLIYRNVYYTYEDILDFRTMSSYNYISQHKAVLGLQGRENELINKNDFYKKYENNQYFLENISRKRFERLQLEHLTIGSFLNYAMKNRDDLAMQGFFVFIDIAFLLFVSVWFISNRELFVSILERFL